MVHFHFHTHFFLLFSVMIRYSNNIKKFSSIFSEHWYIFIINCCYFSGFFFSLLVFPKKRETFILWYYKHWIISLGRNEFFFIINSWLGFTNENKCLTYWFFFFPSLPFPSYLSFHFISINPNSSHLNMLSWISRCASWLEVGL